MIRILALGILTLLVSACGDRFGVFRYIEPRLEPHLDGVVADFKAQGVSIDTSDLSLATEDLPGDLAGHCHYEYRDDIVGNRRYQRTIRVDSAWFERNLEQPTRIKALLAHEIGHCYLNRKHDDRLASGVMTQAGESAPVFASLMHSQIGRIDPVVVSEYWNTYLLTLLSTQGEPFGGKYESLQASKAMAGAAAGPLQIESDFTIRAQ